MFFGRVKAMNSQNCLFNGLKYHICVSFWVWFMAHTFPISVPAGAWRFEPCGVSRAGAEGWKAAHTELKNKYKSLPSKLPSTNSSFLHTLANSLLRNQKQTVHVQIKSWAFSVAFYLFVLFLWLFYLNSQVGKTHKCFSWTVGWSGLLE